MADVLLTHANHLFADGKQIRKMQPYPPLQTLIAAALLRREGFEVALFDSTLESPESGFRTALDRHRPRLVAACEDNFNFLTKMCLTRNREIAFELCRQARARGIPVAVNGSDSSDRTTEYLAAGFDYVILGEVETTLVELTRVLLEDGGEPARILGLAHHDGVGVRYSGPRRPAGSPDALPMPAWDLVDVEAYRAAWLGAHGYFSWNLVSSRGCPYHCNWCAKPIYGQSYEYVSPERTAREMAHCKREIRPDHLWFADDIFALSAAWTQAFAAEVERLDARIPFKMQSRCDLMTRDTVAALARAGCAEVWMGAESGSQRVLDAMDKGIRVEEIHAAAANLRRHGVRACLFLQFGYPGETWDDIEATLRMVRAVAPDDIGVSVAYPLPGTRFHERVALDLGSKQNWSDSDDLALMFRGPYSSELYRTLRDALHLEVDVRRGAAPDEPARLARLWDEVGRLERRDGAARADEPCRSS